MAFFKSRYNKGLQLGARELSRISQDINQRFTANLLTPMRHTAASIRLSPQEMVNISQEISRDFAVHRLTSAPTAKIVLLPVDPMHLHSYWQLDQVSQTTSLSLRIYIRPEHYPADSEASLPQSFDIHLENSEHQCKIELPGRTDNCFYSIAIGNQQQRTFTPLAHSETVFIPGSIQMTAASPAMVDTHGTRIDNASGRGKQ